MIVQAYLKFHSLFKQYRLRGRQSQCNHNSKDFIFHYHHHYDGHLFPTIGTFINGGNKHIKYLNSLHHLIIENISELRNSKASARGFSVFSCNWKKNKFFTFLNILIIDGFRWYIRVQYMMVHMMVYIQGVSQKRPPKLFWPMSHNNKHLKNCFFFAVSNLSH